MLVFVGLGNPGLKYGHNRHNVGFMAIDEIAQNHDFGPAKTKFSAIIHEGRFKGVPSEKIILIKPQTYMNESGRSLSELARFYKLRAEDFIVFHDELDLVPGKVRVKIGGGHAGHNGLRSIDAHIGNNFARVRIGIGHPGSKNIVHKYVLGDFTKSDQSWLEPLLNSMAIHAGVLVDADKQAFAKFQNDIAHDVPIDKKPSRKQNATKSASDKSNDDRPPDKTKTNPAPTPASTIDNTPPSSGRNAFHDALTKLLPIRKNED